MRDKIDDILTKVIPDSWGDQEINKSEAKSGILTKISEAIGPDEIRPASGPKRNGIDQGLRRTRNQLRAQIRKDLGL